MACSKYEYVKKFEQTTTALLESFIVVRIDAHEFEKPNDMRAIRLMNRAAQHVCENFKDIFLAYGQSDEYSFALVKNTTLFSRRSDKILSCIVSAFSSAYVFYWAQYFTIPLKQIPMFDSRIVVYPNQKCLKDYFKWRQVDCHINNLYNTVFWCMVKSGKGNTEAEKILKDTNSGQKNEILFNEFGINYNKLEDVYRRGTFLAYRFVEKQPKNQEQVKEKLYEQTENLQEQIKETSEKEPETKAEGKKYNTKPKLKRKLVQIHEDCIKEQFWLTIL